jgi:hypothetical protein
MVANLAPDLKTAKLWLLFLNRQSRCGHQFRKYSGGKTLKIRKIASLTAALSFLVMLLTSIILYIVPQGRIAYWADWHLWGLTKEQWGNIHINTGFLFLIALGFHIYYNWKPILSYLKDRAKNLKVFTKDFNVAVVLTLLVGLGTYFELPPFSSILDISDRIKDAAAVKYGEPPYGHAELSSMKTFSQKMELDLAESITLLKKAGYTIEGEMQTLLDIAKLNNVSPQKIYSTIKPAMNKSTMDSGQTKNLPDRPPAGTGNLILADLCSQYDLNIKVILRGLSKENINASADLTIKKIAEKNQIGPLDIYAHIRTIAVSQSAE